MPMRVQLIGVFYPTNLAESSLSYHGLSHSSSQPRSERPFGVLNQEQRFRGPLRFTGKFLFFAIGPGHRCWDHFRPLTRISAEALRLFSTGLHFSCLSHAIHTPLFSDQSCAVFLLARDTAPMCGAGTAAAQSFLSFWPRLWHVKH